MLNFENSSISFSSCGVASMTQECALEDGHEFESRSGALKLFQEGMFTGEWVCPTCVEDIRGSELAGYQVFVIEGREMVIPTEEIDV